MDIDTDIRRTKQRLIDKAKKTGIYENFGQKDASKMGDKHIDLSVYSEEMNKNRDKIRAFSQWCMSYTGRG